MHEAIEVADASKFELWVVWHRLIAEIACGSSAAELNAEAI